MQQIELIILYCLKKLNGERTMYSIYHLLNGKKSSQTIQDAHLFSLQRFFGIYEPLTREEFEKIINTMLEKKWIEHCGEQRLIPLANGELYLDNNSLPFYIDGWKYHQLTSTFWERMSLLIQVASNLVFQETRYIPIQKNKEVHVWLKSTLQKMKAPKKEISKILFSELIECLDGVSGIDPTVLVFRLTGFQQIGLTSSQTAKRLNMDIHEYHIAFINTLHYLIQKIEKESNRFLLLPFLNGELKQNNILTLSSRKSWVLLNQGHSLERIAELRRLKLSTIEDHIVEFALNVDTFSIDDYVDKEMQERVLEISRQSATRQLKLIRNKVETATYFQIRLVMAKYGDR